MRFPPELELQVVVSHFMWMLGTKLRSSGKAAVLLTTESSLQFLVKFLNDENQIKSSELSSETQDKGERLLYLGEEGFKVKRTNTYRDGLQHDQITLVSHGNLEHNLKLLRKIGF